MQNTPIKVANTAIFSLVAAFGCLSGATAGTAPQFESSFTSLHAWDVLDFKGGAVVHLDTDDTIPPGYGPQVLAFSGDNVLALAKSLRVADGTLLILYKERNPRDGDADGLLVFDAQYGDDVSIEHNTKTVRPMVWFEQDNDSGVHLVAKGSDGAEAAYAEQSGVGLVTDDWNKTKWIWQKVRLQGSAVAAKYWPAHETEPPDWTLQTSLPERKPARVGFRIGSGDIAVAYFAYDPDDIAPKAPAVYMTPKTEQAPLGQPIPVYLFCNVKLPAGSYRLTLERGDETVAETAVAADLLASKTEHQVVIVPPGSNAAFEESIIVRAQVAGQGNRLVLEEPSGDEVASCKLTCAGQSALLDRLSALRSQIPDSAGQIPAVIDRQEMYYDIARRHLALAASRLEEGNPEGAERPLDYAADAIRRSAKSARAPLERKRLWRKNSVVQTDAGPRIVVYGDLGQSADGLRFEFYGGGQLLGAGTGAQLASGILVKPFFGAYKVQCANPGHISVDYPGQLLATVVEVKDRQISLNGEPFIVKGVNVHSLDSRNPHRSREMVQKLKRLGFNMLRGDHPPVWEVEMAYEENMAWSVLAPFSCASTDEIFANLGKQPMAAAWDKTREFIKTYRDMPGVLLWNSCNEITNETTEFIVSMYPLYKHLDPYARPVHYANLYGQDRWQGQDVMAVNYYFAPGQTPEDRHPLIQRSIAIAKAHKLPIIYTEYNSYYGPLPETGVQAIYGLFQWGIQNGMSGGFLYDKWMSDKHPGVFDQELNVDPRMEAAFIDVFADARIEMMECTQDEVKLRIVNKRPFSLRNFAITFDGDDYKKDLPDVRPRQSLSLSVPCADKTLTGHMQFITHYAFDCKVPFVLSRRN